MVTLVTHMFLCLQSLILCGFRCNQKLVTNWLHWLHSFFRLSLISKKKPQMEHFVENWNLKRPRKKRIAVGLKLWYNLIYPESMLSSTKHDGDSIFTIPQKGASKCKKKKVKRQTRA